MWCALPEICGKKGARKILGIASINWKRLFPSKKALYFSISCAFYLVNWPKQSWEIFKTLGPLILRNFIVMLIVSFECDMNTWIFLMFAWTSTKGAEHIKVYHTKSEKRKSLGLFRCIFSPDVALLWDYTGKVNCLFTMMYLHGKFIKPINEWMCSQFTRLSHLRYMLWIVEKIVLKAPFFDTWNVDHWVKFWKHL